MHSFATQGIDLDWVPGCPLRSATFQPLISHNLK